VGSLLLAELEAEARRRRLTGILMHAQLYAIGFYRRHGYEPIGPVFEEAGIEHVEMRKRL
jgi:predicted GNAT family N-acyltransferase